MLPPPKIQLTSFCISSFMPKVGIQLTIIQMNLEPKKVLILGGTNFMGKALLDALSHLQPPPAVACINRGKIYWNNQARRQHPQVLNFYCDRKEHKDTTATICFVSQHLKINAQNRWSCVVDFSAFRWRDVQSVTKAIQGIADRYIFISTDSIYNNHAKQLRNPIREEEYVLEEEYRAAKANSRSKDTYGYNKLKCELYLNRIKPLPFVCLRLPDVIGPYDNTERLWCTVRWIKESATYPLPLTADEENIRLSFVDSLSVAAQIVKMIFMESVPSSAYNLSAQECLTLKEFILMISKAMGVASPHFRAERNKESNHFYPSVECGAISSEKAIKQIGWNPLPLSEAVQRSVEFFMHKANEYAQQRKDMEKEYRRKVVEKD